MKHKPKIKNLREMPANAERVVHPELGVHCWLIGGKYYRSKNDYLNPPMLKGKDGRVRVVDTSLP